MRNNVSEPLDRACAGHLHRLSETLESRAGRPLHASARACHHLFWGDRAQCPRRRSRPGGKARDAGRRGACDRQVKEAPNRYHAQACASLEPLRPPRSVVGRNVGLLLRRAAGQRLPPFQDCAEARPTSGHPAMITETRSRRRGINSNCQRTPCRTEYAKLGEDGERQDAARRILGCWLSISLSIRRILLASVAVFIVAMLLPVVAPGFMILLISRALTGFTPHTKSPSPVARVKALGSRGQVVATILNDDMCGRTSSAESAKYRVAAPGKDDNRARA
jgi:hypothetical protein